QPYPDKLARMKLNMIMSDVGWTLWAAIQAKISTIDFDFWGWAVERWGRATAKMDSAEFEKWLDEV
ncbi:MAG TPA: LPS biosynthesis choline kinase, partial [Anaerolineae bacterium]